MPSKLEPDFAIAEPALLLDASPEERRNRLRMALVASVAVHIVGIFFLSFAPPLQVKPPELRSEPERQITTLVMPPSLVTQRAPNRAEVSKDITLEALQAPRQEPRPGQAPGVPAAPGRRQAFTPPSPRPSAPSASPQVNLPEAPQVDVAQNRTANTPNPLLGNPQAAPPPKIEPQEKPKIAFENPGSMTGSTTGEGRVKIPQAPRNTIDEIIRTAPRGPQAGLSGGDEGSGGLDPRSPLPGKLGSNYELLSDPMGVDFSPYLIRVLSAVRRNWYAVIPESARFGRQGRTVIQFSIAKDGKVPKLVIAQGSGADALDRAAVAGISASNPFPPLPPEFRGQQIRLQLVFTYNLPR
jgi:TonB family protein